MNNLFRRTRTNNDKQTFVIAFSHTTSKRDAVIAQRFFDIATQRAHDVREMMRTTIERYATMHDDMTRAQKKRVTRIIRFLKRDTLDIVRKAKRGDLSTLKKFVDDAHDEHVTNAHDEFVDIIA